MARKGRKGWGSKRRGYHRAILLDEVSDPQFIVDNKNVLQAHVDGAILGQSATQMYTYEVFLWRTPIMLTTKNWDLTGFSEAALDWTHANSVVVHVADKVYEANTPAPASPRRRRPVTMLTVERSPPH